MTGQRPSRGRVAPAVRTGALRVTGLVAVLVLAGLVALIDALLAWGRPAFRGSILWVSAVLWLAFFAYWGWAARGASAVRSAEPAASRALHSLALNLALVLLFLRVPGLTGRWLPEAWPVIAAGLALHVAAGALAVWARRHLGRHWSGEITAKVDHELVRTGPYRWVRHPIYSAMLGMTAGTALVSGELHALVAMALMSVAYARKIRLEERHLRATFGAAYDDYRRHSRALVPGLF